MAVSHPRLMAVWALLRPVVASSITPRFRPFSTAITARVPTAAVAGEGGECWWEVYQRLAFYVLWCALVYKFVLALRRPLAMVARGSRTGHSADTGTSPTDPPVSIRQTG